MYASLLLRVWVFNEGHLGISFEISDLRQLDVVVDSLSIEFEMEARILKSAGKLDNGLAKILYLFLARNLLITPVSVIFLFWSWGDLSLTITWILYGSCGNFTVIWKTPNYPVNDGLSPRKLVVYDYRLHCSPR